MAKSETNPRPEYWVLSLSGGKDSTALGLKWLDLYQIDPDTYPLDEVIYCDVGMEFPAMVEHINHLETIFIDAGIKFTRLKSEKPFEYWMFEYQPKKRNPELQHLKGKSWPTSRVRWCTGELKQKIISRYFKQLRSQKTVIQLVGLIPAHFLNPRLPGISGGFLLVKVFRRKVPLKGVGAEVHSQTASAAGIVDSQLDTPVMGEPIVFHLDFQPFRANRGGKDHRPIVTGGAANQFGGHGDHPLN